jgi:hypothetical protein
MTNRDILVETLTRVSGRGRSEVEAMLASRWPMGSHPRLDQPVDDAKAAELTDAFKSESPSIRRWAARRRPRAWMTGRNFATSAYYK